MSTDVGTWMNLFTFEPNPGYSPDAGTRLLYPISYKRCYAEFYVRKIPHMDMYRRLAAAATCGFTMVLFTQQSKHFCWRYMRSTECPSSSGYMY